MDGLEFKNKKCIKYRKRATTRILEIQANRNKLSYKCDNKSYNNTFTNWYKPINELETTTTNEGDDNDGEPILHEVMIWIMNHNMEINFVNVKLLLVADLMCAMLLYLTILLFMLNK